MQKLTRVTIAAAATCTLAFAAIAPASAAPQDVQFSATADRNDVTLQFDNQSEQSIQCVWVAKRDTAPEYVYSSFINVQPGTLGTSAKAMADGDYTFTWKCTALVPESEPQESWGTPGMLVRVTADPFHLAVNPPVTGAFGSLGSFFGS